MTDVALRCYHALPPALRSTAATLRGAYLRAWRYGPRTDCLRDEALERESWGSSRWQTWTDARLAFVLQRAAKRVPYYRDLWAARRRRGDRASWEVLENWPILEKEPLRIDAGAFVADDQSRSRMLHEHTSGTTGKSLSLWSGLESTRQWYALHEARSRGWHGLSRHDRWGILGGQLVVPAAQRHAPFWVWNAAGRQLYLSAYHIAPENTRAYANALRRYKLTYLVAYPSALYAIAHDALAQGLELPRLRVAVMNAEPVLAHQRETIERAFDCPVRETYGMSETVAAASECGHGRQHLWPEVGHLEVLEGGAPVFQGKTGEFICTSLLNADMPLIRYRVGDRGAMAPPGSQCECRRTLPLIAQIEGRSDDILYTTDGRAVGRLDPVFKSRLPVREAQIIQEGLAQIRVRYVPASGFDNRAAQSIVTRLRDRLGPVTVVLEEMPAIPRSANGKFRAVVCNLSVEDRAKAAHGS